MGKECHFLMAHRLGYTLFWEIGQKHPKFLLQFTQNQSEHNFFTIQGWLVQSVINPLTWSFLDILVVFRLDLGQLSFNLVKNALCNTPECLSCHQHRILGHFDSGMRRNQNFEKVTYVFRFFNFCNFFFLPFFFLLFFCFCCSDWPSTGLACG